MKKIYLVVLACLLAAGCGQTEPESKASVAAVASVASDENTEAEASLPPSFLDDAPPGPTSATEVLSGGTLVMPDGERISDSIIVITNGQIVAWGARGETDLPNDSIGFDLRGKWIVTDNIEIGAPASFRFSEHERGDTQVSQEFLGGYANGVLDLPESDSD